MVKHQVAYGPLQLRFDPRSREWWVEVVDDRREEIVRELGPFGVDLEKARFEALIAAGQYLEEHSEPIPLSVLW